VLMKNIIFWDVTPCSLLRCHLVTWWFLLKCSSTLKMEAICSSETSVASQQTTRSHIPEDDTLHNHRCENLKSYILHVIQTPLLQTSSLFAFVRYILSQFSHGNEFQTLQKYSISVSSHSSIPSRYGKESCDPEMGTFPCSSFLLTWTELNLPPPLPS
jgi:hypothetical protein